MRLASLLMMAILLCLSCSKDNEEQKEENCLTAVINGDAFTAEATTGTSIAIMVDYEDLGVQSSDFLTINGTILDLSGSTTSIVLTFACSEFTSELDIINSDGACGISMNYQSLAVSDPSASIAVLASEGIINVEELTEERIRGTFSFKGEDANGNAYDITDGFFDTTIQ